jgi:formylglycine-generating enzyme required for sulfatase activity
MAADNRTIRRQLFTILCDRFDLEDLRTLCFLLEVSYDSLRGEGQAAKARELIAYAQRRGLLLALVEEGKVLRPDVVWPDDARSNDPGPTPNNVPPPGKADTIEHAPRVVRADDIDGCVFISYERADQAYARRLADELLGRGLKPWMDDRIDFGDRWWRTIVRAIEASAAFIVLMTPEARASRWVHREVLLADSLGKPMFPLLLRGKVFPLLIDVQYADVRAGGLPSRGFYGRLDRALGVPGAQGGSAPVHAVEAERAAPVVDRTPAVPKAPPPVEEARELPRVLPPGEPFEPEMVLIPAGEFLMGSDPQVDKYAYDDEQPQHPLTLSDYYLARTPVTNAQYLAFVQAAGHSAPKHWQSAKPPRDKENHPVVYVSWNDVLAYCRWLAQATGKPYSLPSEAEWEKGARGAEGWIYPWGNEWDQSLCNSSEGGKGEPTPVGAYPNGASPYGLLDMAGNVWEWTRSLKKSYPYTLDDGREDLEASGARVLRGGAFANSEGGVRCAYRNTDYPGSWHGARGFRVVVAPGFPL